MIKRRKPRKESLSSREASLLIKRQFTFLDLMKVKLGIGDKQQIVECLTVGDLAFIMGRKTTTIKRAESSGAIPKAPFQIMQNGLPCRIYPKPYAIKFAYIYLTEVKQNISMPEKTRQKILLLRQNCRKEYGYDEEA